MSYRFSAGIVYNNFPWPLVAIHPLPSPAHVHSGASR